MARNREYIGITEQTRVNHYATIEKVFYKLFDAVKYINNYWFFHRHLRKERDADDI